MKNDKHNGPEDDRPEAIEEEEYVPENGHAEELQVIMSYDPHLLERLEITHLAARRAIEMIDDLVKTSLRMTKARHWYDYEGRPYIKESGVMIVKRGLPIEIAPVGKMTFQTFSDERGPYYIAEIDVRAFWTNGMFGAVTVKGTASSRDPLVGRKGGEDVPIQEIDRTKVMRKADTNGRRRAMMRLLGLDDMSWDEFTKLTGVKREDVEKVSYAGEGADKTKDDTDETKDKREKMREMILEICGNDGQKAQDYLERLTTWTPKGKDQPVKGKRQIKALSAKQVEINFGKVKRDHEEFLKGQKSRAEEEAKRGLFE